ncbi:MAG TPA: hypothetical protein VKE51_21690 [Vicinamibacterales bacterium]|nr:hypothetical protein [Vicinamibacterales bacterium]
MRRTMLRACLTALLIGWQSSVVFPQRTSLFGVPEPGAPLGVPIRGISYFSFKPGAFADNTQGQTLDFIRSTGANWICITTLHMYDPASNQIRDFPTQTDFSGLATAVARARQRGLKVLLRLTLETPQNQAIGSIPPPGDATTFFRQFTALLVTYATLARDQGAEMLSLGSEMGDWGGPKYRSNWLDAINAVRSVYSGPVTYGAFQALRSAATLANLETSVSFWDQLDYLGVSIYPQLSAAANPPRDELERNWRRNSFTGTDVIGILQQYSALTKKPILITDTGYVSADGAAINPGATAPAGTNQNDALQALLYDVLFASFKIRSGSWLAGLFLWEIPATNLVNSPGATFLATDYSFMGKPAANVVSLWYGGTPAPRVADQVFDYLESTHRRLFAPADTPTEESNGTFTRHYASSDSALVIRGNSVSYAVGSEPLTSLGTLSSWYTAIR